MDGQNQMGRNEVLEAISHNQPKQDIVKDVERALRVDEAVMKITSYYDRSKELRNQRIPLFGERMELTERLTQIEGDIEMEVMLEYPPRKGSEKQRDLLRSKLRSENPKYQEYQGKLNDVKLALEDIEFQERMLDEEVKHARRLVELHSSYLQVIASY